MHSTMTMMRRLTVLLMLVLLALPTLQDSEDDDYPRPIAPGETILPIEDLPDAETGCFPAFPLIPGDVIYIEPGVNIRNIPSQSGAIVWNTIIDNRDERGNVIDDPFNVEAVIVDGPVCNQGLNWWQITGTGNPGWVAEGRRDYEGGYWISAPGTEMRGVCNSTYPFEIGETVDLLYNVRIHDAPTSAALTKTVVPYENPVLILAGPQCVDSVRWWYVRAEVVGIVYDGWMAEGGNEVALMIPQDLPSLEDGTLCAPPYSILSIGLRGYVNYTDGMPKSLRALPGTDQTLLFTLVDGVPFIIEGGPVCVENMNWWQIRVLASTEVVGWMSEGSPGVGYWMARVNPDEFRFSNPPGRR
ncbi:MAG: hypothetical protein KC708_17275 [Anaerolineae bacterium]|nr:hypothetical protein [Anaerolineae bacterium]